MKLNSKYFCLSLIIAIAFSTHYTIIAQPAHIKLIALDSLTGESLNGYFVYCNDIPRIYSGDSSNIIQISIDCDTNVLYNISIIHFGGYPKWESSFRYMALNCYDTIIYAYLKKYSKPRIFPTFYFDNNQFQPDTILFQKKINVLKDIITVQNNLIFYVEGYCGFDENHWLKERLDSLRADFIIKELINEGIDSSRLQLVAGGLKPYIIEFEEDTVGPLRYKDILSAEYIENLSVNYRPIANKLNRRVEFTVSLKKVE
jgi:hypothetical protein